MLPLDLTAGSCSAGTSPEAVASSLRLTQCKGDGGPATELRAEEPDVMVPVLNSGWFYESDMKDRKSWAADSSRQVAS